jgi:hypothetical protein
LYTLRTDITGSQISCERNPSSTVNSSAADVWSTNRDLKAKQLDLYRQLPQHLIWDPTTEDITEIDLEIGYPKLLIRLDHLLNSFLIQRLFVKHGHPRNDLLRTSFEMVVLTLNFWAQKHVWAALQGKCRWIVSWSSFTLVQFVRSDNS